jgi:hypothetical protein
VAGLLAPALAYAARGWPVFPCHTPHATRGCSCGQAECGSPGKHPRTRNGLYAATTDPDAVAAWWHQWPWANIGLRTGGPSGLVVVDVDPPHGLDTLARIAADIGGFPEGHAVSTGSGGVHLYFALPPVELRNSASKLGSGIDLRADGGYVIAPPSLHASGQRYRWNRNPDLPPLPAALVSRLAAARSPASAALPPRDMKPWARAAVDGELDRLHHAPTGARNHTLNRASFVLGQIAAGGAIDPDVVHDLLVDAGQAIGLGGREVEATVTSGLRAGLQRPRGPVDRPRTHGVDIGP